ncbi:hypothetical protein EHH54_13090 [Rhizobium leguminosarum]|uniref:hypothetical protein n=1 Tax=Rhizobium leguminosarum TaxID=384 RepID=UPI000FEC5D75|nr:hypothetical protein [Rhizobium leguminosarum]RWX40267.1 hypothetical protein EHH54_13090 [Rhizobium leguminosarum]
MADILNTTMMLPAWRRLQFNVFGIFGGSRSWRTKYEQVLRSQADSRGGVITESDRLATYPIRDTINHQLSYACRIRDA